MSWSGKGRRGIYCLSQERREGVYKIIVLVREGEEGYILSWPGKGRRGIYIVLAREGEEYDYIVLAREGEEGYILSWSGKGRRGIYCLGQGKGRRGMIMSYT